jgi:hypothetical protein
MIPISKSVLADRGQAGTGVEGCWDIRRIIPWTMFGYHYNTCLCECGQCCEDKHEIYEGCGCGRCKAALRRHK